MKAKQCWVERTTWYLFLVLVGLTANLQAGQTNIIEYKPVWSVGQKWRVDVEKMTEPPSVSKERLAKWKSVKYTITYQFTMERFIEIDGENCCQIRVESIAINGSEVTGNEEVFYRIFLRQADNTLKMVERLRGKIGHIENSRKFSKGAIDVTDYVGNIPMALPAFSIDGQAREMPIRTNEKGEVVFKDSDRCRQSEEVVLKQVEDKKTDALKIVLEKDLDKKQSIRITQTWMKGMPWWTEIEYERNGKKWCSAKLLKD